MESHTVLYGLLSRLGTCFAMKTAINGMLSERCHMHATSMAVAVAGCKRRHPGIGVAACRARLVALHQPAVCRI